MPPKRCSPVKSTSAKAGASRGIGTVSAAGLKLQNISAIAPAGSLRRIIIHRASSLRALAETNLGQVLAAVREATILFAERDQRAIECEQLPMRRSCGLGPVDLRAGEGVERLRIREGPVSEEGFVFAPASLGDRACQRRIGRNW